jgi:hypothetical protein
MAPTKITPAMMAPITPAARVPGSASSVSRHLRDAALSALNFGAPPIQGAVRAGRADLGGDPGGSGARPEVTTTPSALA